MPSPADGTRGALPAWLFLPDLRARGGELVLEGDDAHYVARVCRAAAGDTLTASDGRGMVATLELLAVRGEVRARVLTLREAPRAARAVVACGAPEKDRADWLVEKLGELGVAELQPLECERGGWERFASRRDRLERLTAAALRQSRRPWRLEILEPREPAAWLAGLAGGVRWLADAEGGPAGEVGGGPLEVGAIGPASGFTPGEREAFLSTGFAPVRLATARLRTETAALLWAGLWAAREASRG